MRSFLFVVILLQFFSCGPYLNQPLGVSEAKIVSKTNLEKELIDLPKPRDPVVIAVYKFKDQTGQYKPSEVGSSFSTAVTQGGTNILIKALDDSGWFKVIERENIGNLLNERKIIRQTRMQYDAESSKTLLVNPLLFAGVILEGGIVSYDANIMTGGIGVRYFGSGGSAAYRQDRVTVYLRAIATKTGEVLKNITTSKTILSQSLDGGVFRFVKFSRLLEAETGFTFNEPADIAVTEAVQKAVYSLIVEGIKDGLWSVDSSYSEEAVEMMDKYEEQISETELKDYLGIRSVRKAHRFSIYGSTSGLYYQGDYPASQLNLGGGLFASYEINSRFGLDAGVVRGSLETSNGFDRTFTSVELNSRIKLLRNQRRNPFLRLGVGNIYASAPSTSNIKFRMGVGIDLNLTNSLSVSLFTDWNQFYSDGFDGISAGRYIDYYYQFGIGAKYHLSFKKEQQ